MSTRNRALLVRTRSYNCTSCGCREFPKRSASRTKRLQEPPEDPEPPNHLVAMLRPPCFGIPAPAILGKTWLCFSIPLCVVFHDLLSRTRGVFKHLGIERKAKTQAVEVVWGLCKLTSPETALPPFRKPSAPVANLHTIDHCFSSKVGKSRHSTCQGESCNT